MSQYGTEDHIFKRLGHDLDRRRLVESDDAAMKLLRQLRALGYSGDDVQSAMNRLVAGSKAVKP